MSIIFFILSFVLIIVFFVLAVFGSLISSVFRAFRGQKKQSCYDNREGGGGNQRAYSSTAKEEKNKVFSKEEGEYVTYEEIE